MNKFPFLKWLVPALVIVGIALAIWKPFGGKEVKSDAAAVFETQRGDLTIDVLEGGNIHALESLEILNEVKISAGTKILNIIEEGYEVTEKDVEEGKVLVTLDASAVEEEIVDHDVQFQETQASYVEAKQNIEIQASENTSEIKLVRQLARFALLDFEKFVGAKAAKEIIHALALPYDTESFEAFERETDEIIAEAFDANTLLEADGLAAAEPAATDSADSGAGAASADDGEEMSSSSADDDPVAKKAKDLIAKSARKAETVAQDEAAEAASSSSDQNGSQASGVDFASFLEEDRLGAGEAEQTIRRMRDEALLARTEMAVVEEAVEGAIRLHKENFITTSTLENEKVTLEKAKLTLKTAETELELFRDYEFPKEAEKMLSVYEEALLELVREKREAMAQQAEAESRFRSRKRRYELELKKREDLQAQLDSCIIVAKKPGLVAYGGGKSNYYNSRYYEAISEGAALKTGQPIITIPDMSHLAVDVNIHESHIKKIQLGQTARITVDAVPDKTLEGTVTKVAVLPDSNASRYNPSLKVYPSTIKIEGTHDWLKPGMTAKVEIIVRELENVLYVPVQSIFVEEDQHFVFVESGGKRRRQSVTVGEHNNEFIEVMSGLDEGDIVMLSTPDDFEPGDLIKELDTSSTQLSSAESGTEDEA